MTFIGGIVVFFMVGFYMDGVLADEMRSRVQAIEHEIDARQTKMVKDGSRHQPNAIVYGGHGRSNWDYLRGWNATVRFIRGGEVRRSGDPAFIRRDEMIFSMNLRIVRSRLRVEPIEVDYDDAEGNVELLAAFQALCEKWHWRLVARKVARLEN